MLYRQAKVRMNGAVLSGVTLRIIWRTARRKALFRVARDPGRSFPEPDLTGQYLPNLTRWHGGVTQDHAGPFCTMGLRIARGFCASRDNLLGVPARQALGRSSGKTNSNERKEWKPIHRGLISSSDGGPHLRIGRYKGTSGPHGSTSESRVFPARLT
jgi:hypothetical protein